jgi:hypothetical protein
MLLGHTTIISLSYGRIYDWFGHVPSLLVTGPRHTGKTLYAEVSVSYVATNAEDICVVKDSTLASLRKRSLREHMPLIINDPQDDYTVITALQELYEGKTVQKSDEKIKPSSSIMITMNEGLTATIRAK